MGCLLLGIGGIAALVGGIWILVVAFRESKAWGFGIIAANVAGNILVRAGAPWIIGVLTGAVTIAFVVQHWAEARKPFLVYVVGICLLLGGVLGTPEGRKMIDQTGGKTAEVAEDEEEDDAASSSDSGTPAAGSTPAWEQSWQERQRQAERAPERPVVPSEYPMEQEPPPATDMQRFEYETRERERDTAEQEQAEEAPAPE